jgi:two-component system, chemotaxis family, response regulator WspF
MALHPNENSSHESKLLAKIARIGKLLKSTTTSKIFTLASGERQNNSRLTVPLVAISSSTGAPKALATILSKLLANFNSAIAIVQHVDAQFSSGLVEWLNQQSKLPVRLASVGESFQKGTVSVAFKYCCNLNIK